jgi:hypothetical protein
MSLLALSLERSFTPRAATASGPALR